MTYKEALRRFGLPASQVDRGEIRRLLATETGLARRWEDREEMLRTLCVLLFSLGAAEDALLIWAAKQSNFDAGSGIVDVQFLCGAGLPATKSFLAHSDAPEAAEALRHLTECESTGDFQRFTPTAWVSSYRRYYGLDASTRPVQPSPSLEASGDLHAMSETKPSSGEARVQRREHRLRKAMFPGMLLGFASLLAGYFLYRLDILSQEAGGTIGLVGGGLGMLLAFLAFRRASRHPVT